MKRDTLPSFQFYPGDWRKDPAVQALSFFDRGVWFEILMLMHESSERGVLLLNGKPMPEEALARALGLDKQTLQSSLTTLLEYGVASKREDGALYNRRMVRDEEIRSIRQKAGSSGGNPILLKQKSSKIKIEVNHEDNHEDNQIPEDEDEDEDVNEVEVIKKKKEQPEKAPQPALQWPPLLDRDDVKTAWNRWLDHKKARGERYKSVHSQQAKLKEWAEKPEEFIRAIEFSMGNNWAGIFAPKADPPQKWGERKDHRQETLEFIKGLKQRGL